MEDRELLAAAELAKRHLIYDRAINTADKTKNEHDYSLRYLALRRPRPAGGPEPVPRRRLGSRPDAPGKPFHHQRQIDGGRIRADAADAGHRQMGGKKIGLGF